MHWVLDIPALPWIPALHIVPHSPLHALVAKTNMASAKPLVFAQPCGLDTPERKPRIWMEVTSRVLVTTSAGASTEAMPFYCQWMLFSHVLFVHSKSTRMTWCQD